MPAFPDRRAHETTPSMLAVPARSTPARRPTELVRRDPRRLAMLVVLAFAATSVGVLSLPSTTLAWSANTFNSSSERQLVSLTNQARASAGLRSLRVDSTLTAIARSRSKDMIVRNYFSHNIPPSGYLVFHILDTKGYCYKIAGENIGWNTYPDDVATAEIQSAFMGSAGHRANILGKAWDVIGIGAYKGPDGKKMWTVLFADKCGSTSTAPKPTPKPTAKPRPRATPRPTPRSTPKPKPTPKPAVAAASPSPSPSPSPTPPIPSGTDETAAPDPSTSAGGAPEAGSAPGAIVRDADPTTAEGSLRVTDPPTSPGLLDTIISGITGSLLGG